MATARRPRLSVDDWAEAALHALAEGGLPAVAVEPLAARLGATKGSFYWHFANRDALIVAALDRWERRHTQDIIAALDTEPEGSARLRRLLQDAFSSVGRDRLGAQILAEADHPLVADAVRRVVVRRVDYVAELFMRAGFGDQEARHRAVLAYAAYCGHEQLALRLPGAIIVDAAYRAVVLDLLLAGRPAERPSTSAER